MTKIGKIAAAFLLSASLALSGCYPTGEKPLTSTSGGQGTHSGNSGDISNSGGNSELTQPFVGTVSQKVGDVEFNYEISADYPTKASKIKLKPKKFDTETLKKVFLRDKTIVSEINGWRIETSDGSLLCAWGDHFDFSDNIVDDSRSNFHSIPRIYDDYCYSSDEQLKAFPSADAVERVNKLLGELGIENYGEPCIIPVSPEIANAYLKEYGLWTKNKEQDKYDYDLWTDDDGVYVLRYYFKYNGIDVSSGNIKTLGTAMTIHGADITAYVNKDTIFHLEVTSLYDAVSLDEGTFDLKFDAGRASDALIDHYSKLAAVAWPIYFTRCKLEYVPVEYSENNEIVFAPAWCFTGYKLTHGVNPWDTADYYYAETGIRYGSF